VIGPLSRDWALCRMLSCFLKLWLSPGTWLADLEQGADVCIKRYRTLRIKLPLMNLMGLSFAVCTEATLLVIRAPKNKGGGCQKIRGRLLSARCQLYWQSGPQRIRGRLP